MMDYIISIIAAYFSSGLESFYFFPLLTLAFIAVVPCLIRYFFRR